MVKTTSNYVYSANGVEFKIYHTVKPSKSGLKPYWVLADYSTGKRRLLNHQTKQEAERRADTIRAAMAKGQTNRLALSHGQWQEVCIAMEVVRAVGTGETLSTAARQWADARAMLAMYDNCTSISDVVHYYVTHLQKAGKHVPVSFAEATTPYHEFKVNGGKSTAHCENIECRLGRLVGLLPKGIMTDELTAGQLDEAVMKMNLGPKTTNEYRIMMVNFFKWAAKQSPPMVPKGFNPAMDMERKRVIQGEVKFLRVAELKTILTNLPAKRPDLLPLVVLICFAGLRPSEAVRLDWAEVGDDYIRLPGTKSKTGYCRQIPIQPNLEKWLKPWRKPKGPICPDVNLVHVNPALLRVASVKIEHDALRHGYGTHRQRVVKNIGQVSEEMGNSMAICKRHYANPFCTETEALEWFNIYPDETRNSAEIPGANKNDETALVAELAQTA